MWQKILLQQKKKQPDGGFITLEILVSIIIALAFVAFSMQALVLSMMLKVQAQEKQRADQLIQQDIELLNDLATTAIAGDCDADNNNDGTVTYAQGYADGLWDAIDAEPLPTKQLLRTINDDGTINSEGVTLTLAREHISVDTDYSDAPHRTLKIYYQVTNNNNELVAKRYVEVIPDVALECP